MRDPLDPFSKAMNDQNRWDPEWYTWLQELAKATTRLETAVPPTTDLTPITAQITVLQAQVAVLQAQIATLPPPGLVFLSTQNASNSSTIVFTGMTTAYDAYQFNIRGLAPSSNNAQLLMQMSVNNGSSWLNVSNIYTWVYTYMGAATVNPHNSTSEGNTTYFRLGGATNSTWGNASEVMVYPNSGQNLNQIIWRSSDWYDAGGGTYQVIGSGHEASNSTPLNAVRFFFSAGVMTIGHISMYGLRKI